MSKAESVTPPYASDNVIVLSGNTTAQRVKLPDEWRKEWIIVTPVGVNAGVLFGGPAVAADLAATTTISAEVPTINATACAYIADGRERSWDLGQIVPHHLDVYVSVDCDASAGTVILERVSGKVQGV